LSKFKNRSGFAGANIISLSDNVDGVIKQLAKLETKVTNQLVVETRKAIKAEVRNSRTMFKKITPKGKTGALRRSVKVKSRTKKGVTKVSLYWNIFYAGYVNFWKKSPHYKKVTNGYKANKSILERNIKKRIVDTQRVFFNKNGIKAE